MDQVSNFDAPYQENRKPKYYGARSFLANQGIKTNATIERFLELVRTETKEEVDKFLLPLLRTAENERNSQSKLSEQLEEALAQSDVVEVWKLIAKINETDGKKTDSNETNSNEINCKKTLEDITDVCKIIAKRDNNNEDGVISSAVGIARQLDKQ